jgi:hypothetical protein
MTEHFSHKERRYLIPIGLIEHLLPEGRTYSVRTEYLDTPERTWSALTMNEEHPKIRLRTYNDKDIFLEKKLHKNGETTKERIAVARKPDGLIEVGRTRYERTEYLFGESRVTIDRNVSAYIDTPIICLGNILLVEIKGEVPKPLECLEVFRQKNFSKWKWLSRTLEKQHASIERRISSERTSESVAA